MAKPSVTGARLIGLFLGGCLLLNYPLLHLFNLSADVFGIPLLFIYAFGAWGLIIALAAVVLSRRE